MVRIDMGQVLAGREFDADGTADEDHTGEDQPQCQAAFEAKKPAPQDNAQGDYPDHIRDGPGRIGQNI